MNSNPVMDTVEDIRRYKLGMLKEEHGTWAALNRALGRTSRDATLNQIANRSRDSKTGRIRELGSKQAREIEKALGKRSGWLDRPTDAMMAAGLVGEDDKLVRPLPAGGVHPTAARNIPTGTDQFLISLPFHPPFGDISYLSLGLYDPTGQMFTDDSLSMPSAFASLAAYMRYFFWLPWHDSTTAFEFSSDSAASARFTSIVGSAPISAPPVSALLIPALVAGLAFARRSRGGQ